jgi:hypothetical protein
MCDVDSFKSSSLYLFAVLYKLVLIVVLSEYSCAARGVLGSRLARHWRRLSLAGRREELRIVRHSKGKDDDVHGMQSHEILVTKGYEGY